MKLSNSKLRHLINEVIEEASKDAPFGPFTSRKSYVASQRAAKLPGKVTKKLADLDRDMPFQSREMDRAFGIDNPEQTVHSPAVEAFNKLKKISPTMMGGAVTFKPLKYPQTQAVVNKALGKVYKIGDWTYDQAFGISHIPGAPKPVSGGIFSQGGDIFILGPNAETVYQSNAIANRPTPLDLNAPDRHFWG